MKDLPQTFIKSFLKANGWTAIKQQLKITLTTTYILKSLIQTNAACPVIQKQRLNKNTT